jgi:hypothetical protein
MTGLHPHNLSGRVWDTPSPAGGHRWPGIWMEGALSGENASAKGQALWRRSAPQMSVEARTASCPSPFSRVAGQALSPKAEHPCTQAHPGGLALDRRVEGRPMGNIHTETKAVWTFLWGQRCH